MADDEIVLPADPEFEQKCIAALGDEPEKFGWRFGRSVLTRSEKWGLIWRVDQIRGSYPRRIVVWWSLPVEADGFGTGYYPFADPPLP